MKHTLENPTSSRLLLRVLNCDSEKRVLRSEQRSQYQKAANNLCSLLAELKGLSNASNEQTAEAAIARINSHMELHPFNLVLDDWGELHVLSAPGPTSEAIRYVNEPDLSRTLLQLFASRKIHLLRRCEWDECGQWYIAARVDQKFHAVPCRRKHEASSPEFKSRRAAYMKSRYAQEKERDQANRRFIGETATNDKG